MLNHELAVFHSTLFYYCLDTSYVIIFTEKYNYQLYACQDLFFTNNISHSQQIIFLYIKGERREGGGPYYLPICCEIIYLKSLFLLGSKPQMRGQSYQYFKHQPFHHFCKKLLIQFTEVSKFMNILFGVCSTTSCTRLYFKTLQKKSPIY